MLLTMEEKLLLLQRLFRLRTYLYAFHRYLSNLPDNERFRFYLYKGISASTYTHDLIMLVEKIISSLSEDLSRFLIDDLPAD